MTVEQARELLRSELLAVAAVAVPGQQGVVTSDDGPVRPAAVPGASRSFCRVTVETGDPDIVDAGRQQVATAGSALRQRGWEVGELELEAGHHRLAAARDGYDIAIHAWDGDWRVTLTGVTPGFDRV